MYLGGMHICAQKGFLTFTHSSSTAFAADLRSHTLLALYLQQGGGGGCPRQREKNAEKGSQPR